MNYQKEKIGNGQLEIKVELRAEEFDQFVTKTKEMVKEKTILSGFRQGKAPFSLVEKKYGEAKILEETAEIAITETLEKVFQQEAIEFLGQPKIEILKLAKGNPFIFSAIFILLPKIELGDFKKIKVSRRAVDVPPGKIDEVLKELQEVYRQEKLVERSTQLGDRIEVDLELFLDGLPLEEGKVNNASFFLGKDYYLPGFLENLKGLKIGENKNFFVSYPENHFDKRLAGRQVEFRVKANKVFAVQLPILNDDFAKKNGPFQNLVELKAEIKKNLNIEAQKKEEERLEITILKSLINSSKFEEIPKVFIEEEKKKMTAELKDSLTKMKLNFVDYLNQIKKTQEDLEKEFTPKAEERVKAALIIKAIAEKEKITVDEKELKSEIEKQKEFYKDQAEILKNINSPAYKNYFYNLLLNQKVLDRLKKEATVEN